MKKFYCATLMLLLLVVSGCNQEKAQVETYLKQLQASNDAMKAVANEMETSMGGLRQEIASGNFDPEKIKGQIKGFEDKMRAEKSKLEGYTVPEKAKTLHDTTVKQYDVAINVLGKTPAMIDVAKKMSDGSKKLADPKQKQAALTEMQGYQGEMMKIQGQVVELAKQGQELQKTAESEKKKLEDEFKLAPAPSATPAPAAGAPAAAPAGAPAAATPAAPATP